MCIYRKQAELAVLLPLASRASRGRGPRRGPAPRRHDYKLITLSPHHPIGCPSRAPPWRAVGVASAPPGAEGRRRRAGAGKMAAAERSRSPAGGSPVPACMFAPEPGSPGGRPRLAAAACSLRSSFEAEDGEALNGEPEIDLTSKVGPAAGRGWAFCQRVPAGGKGLVEIAGTVRGLLEVCPVRPLAVTLCSEGPAPLYGAEGGEPRCAAVGTFGCEGTAERGTERSEDTL